MATPKINQPKTVLDTLLTQINPAGVASGLKEAKVNAPGKINNPAALEDKPEPKTAPDIIGSLIKPISPEEQTAREKAYLQRQYVAGLGSALSSLGNVLYAGGGAVAQPVAELPGRNGAELTSWQDRIMQDRLRQSNLELAEQQRQAEESYRLWQQQQQEQAAERAQQNADRDYRYQLEKDKLRREDEQAALVQEQKNWQAKFNQDKTHQQNQDKRANDESEALVKYREAQAEKLKRDAESKNWYPYEGYDGLAIELDKSRLGSAISDGSIEQQLPDDLKQNWKYADDKFSVIAKAMQNSPEFQQWMMDQGYARQQELEPLNLNGNNGGTLDLNNL